MHSHSKATSWIAMAAVAVASLSAYFGFSRFFAGSPLFILVVGGPLVALAALSIALIYKSGGELELRSWFRYEGGDIARGFAAAAVLFGCAYLFTRVVMPPGSMRELWIIRVYLQLSEPSEIRSHAVFVAIAIFLLAIAEEIIWRGWITSLLESRFGPHGAWFLATLLYAAVHVPTMWSLRVPGAGLNPLLVLLALAGGLVWGGMRRRFDRLSPAILAHALFMWCAVAMFRLWGMSM